MKQEDVDRIAAWLAVSGLGEANEGALAREFCGRCMAAGLPLGRGFVMIDTLHPLHEARAFFWDEDPENAFREEELPFSREGSGREQWLRSPFLHMLRDRRTTLRCRLEAGETHDYSALEELREQGQTDYFAIVHRFRDSEVLDEVYAFYARWTTRRQGGFSDDEIIALERLSVLLGLAIRAAAQARLARTLVEAYLGRDPGRRILSGRIIRGEVERINTVLWFSDMTGYTTLSEKIESDQLIPLLNDYAEVAIAAIHGAGGDVLKLIGDGVLAIFPEAELSDACVAAMRAEADLRRRIADLQASRRSKGLPVADLYLGLHVGDVFYGNIGSPDRLDFTVVGPAVNEANRIASMCRSVDRHMLCSSAFADLLPAEEREKLVSVGRFALRGVGHATDLLTLDPELVAPPGS
ncbi:adenylate/guanylate cyclase domain-containing protein [Arvimicrobium flavum]|uniref:adenylate/guanylate cyclase domain-containing protein n=1 Tax=Arvimicrobium flavum TaxID=3393320 RepID=UPI00237BDD69|nr:adenylate/guanylate cyclase domain-containing protein [Mesorhizobium shangrilense]